MLQESKLEQAQGCSSIQASSKDAPADSQATPKDAHSKPQPQASHSFLTSGASSPLVLHHLAHRAAQHRAARRAALRLLLDRPETHAHRAPVGARKATPGRAGRLRAARARAPSRGGGGEAVRAVRR
eukprot:1830255-Prymnesium_polylepis.1